MSDTFFMDAKVRFTQERLAVLTPRDRQGLAGRIGVIQTDGNLVRKPTVYFPQDGAKPEIRLFRVDPRHLELVEKAPETMVSQRLDDGESSSEPAAGVSAPDTGATEESGNLSQSDMDNFFD